MSSPPLKSDYSDFANIFATIVNVFRIRTSDKSILNNLKKTNVYDFLIKDPNFVSALKKFKEARQKHGDIFINDDLSVKEYDTYNAISLMSLFARANQASASIKDRSRDTLKTLDFKITNKYAKTLESISNLLEDGSFLVPSEIAIMQKMVLSSLVTVLTNKSFHALPQRSTGLELLPYNHFVFNLYHTYKSRYQHDGDQLIKSITLDLINIIGGGRHEESVKKWINESIEAHYASFKHYYFILKDAKNLSKYGAVSGRM